MYEAGEEEVLGGGDGGGWTGDGAGECGGVVCYGEGGGEVVDFG